MWKSNDKVNNFALLNNEKALSLVELIVITFIIAIIATMAFPTYKIFQQRSKEKRLKKILTDVRAAINGTKSHNSSNEFEEGFRTVARLKGMDRIEQVANEKGWIANENGWNSPPVPLPDNAKDVKQKCINTFIAKLGEGYGYPKSPKEIWSSNPVAAFPTKLTGFCPDTGNDTRFNEIDIGDISLGRPFYRNCDISSGPVHPFHDWYPTVEFAYVPASDTRGIDYLANASYTVDEWATMNPDPDHPVLIGVKDIVSRGVGLALDGSNTDDW